MTNNHLSVFNDEIHVAPKYACRLYGFSMHEAIISHVTNTSLVAIQNASHLHTPTRIDFSGDIQTNSLLQNKQQTLKQNNDILGNKGNTRNYIAYFSSRASFINAILWISSIFVSLYSPFLLTSRSGIFLP